MVLEYKLEQEQRRKFIIFPLLKLITIILIATVVAILWFHITMRHLVFVISMTWAWAFLMHIFPVLVIGLKHKKISEHAVLLIDSVKETYNYKDKDLTLTFHSSEVEKVVKVLSPPKYDNRADILGFGHFYYWKIILVDGRVLSVSGMLLDVEEFPGITAKREKKIFPIPQPNK